MDTKIPEKSAELSFESFDGGGPEYTVAIDDPGVLSVTRSVRYAKADHAFMTGAGYTVTFTFAGLAPGATGLVVSARSPIAENFDASYRATVDEDRKVTLEPVRQEDVRR